MRIGELEAVCVSQEHDLSDLCNEIKSLSENCEKLEVEKMKSLQNAEDSASNASQRILKLEKVSRLLEIDNVIYLLLSLSLSNLSTLHKRSASYVHSLLERLKPHILN